MRAEAARAFTVIEVMIAVAIVSALAAIAIPAYGKFVRRSKTVEVYEALDKIGTGAATYFLAEHNDSDGRPLAREFPGSGRPAVISATDDCCTESGGLCKYNPRRFQGDVWQALLFSIDADHRYRYEYQSWQQGARGARYRARARGDLDCDGVKAVWTQTGWFDETTGVDIRQVRILPDNEIE